MGPYKVIHVITRLDRGGSAQNTLLTAIGHEPTRFESLVVAGQAGQWDDQGGDLATDQSLQRLEVAKVRCLLVPTLTREIHPMKDLATFVTLVRIFRREKPALVHTHTSKAGVLGRLAAWMAGVPLVVHTPHGHVFYGHFGRVASWVFLQVERLLAFGTTHLIALTEAERDEHLAKGVGRADRFSVVPSGIDLERFRCMAGLFGRRPQGMICPPDAIMVGSVGWLTEVKGHKFLIEALARLKPQHPRLHVVIVGSGRLREEYLALAERLGVGEAVHLLGERQDVPDCLAGMDLFVLPSHNEGMGRALVEAMAAGRPVIASNVGGIPTLIEDRRTGRLVPPGDVVALAEAIDELVRRPDMAKALGAAASESIGSRFGAQAMVQAVEAVYETALAKGGEVVSSSRPGHWCVCALGWLVMAVVCGWTGPVIGASDVGPEFRPLVAAFHVHSRVSTGTLSLDELAERAERLGIDAVVLTENFVLRYEYGLFPLRGSIRHAVALPSVLDYGLERYFADVAAAQARHPNVLLVPGVEVVPHYFWTGSLAERNLTMHNSQKNLLLLGLSKPEDYASLPVNGNQASYHYGWNSLWELAPAIVFVPAVWLMTRRYRTAAAMLGLTGGLLLVSAWPFGQPVFSSYDDRLGDRPYQALIDAASERGGLVVWSMPEARDFNVYPFGPLGNVTVKTDPYPEALVRTTGYTGFGGLYQDTRTVTQPGGIWDQVLKQYLIGQRSQPPFALGEIAFHTPGSAGIELDQVLTVFWVKDRTVDGLIDALRQGRFYATGKNLRLDIFHVESQGSQSLASPGEVFNRTGACDVTVRLSVTATDKGAYPISVTIIRSGQIVSKVAGVTPFEQQFVDDTAPPDSKNFYRVEVEGAGEILSNPVFIGPVLAESNGGHPSTTTGRVGPLNGSSGMTAEH